jgi:hypothetical protein
MTGKYASIHALPPEPFSNLQKTFQFLGGITLRYLSDTECIQYLESHFDAELVADYKAEQHGSFRGDICRSALLLKEGGYYMDLDLELHVPLASLVGPKTTLMSVYAFIPSTVAEPVPMILNALMAMHPGSFMMQRVMEEVKTWYRLKRTGLLGPVLMAETLTLMIHRNCPHVNLKAPGMTGDWQCGSDNFRFYQQEYIGDWQQCLANGQVVCPPQRAASFDGARYGIFRVGGETREQRLVGWPRFAECKGYACGMDVGVVSMNAVAPKSF